jgi:glutamyl-tRNA reductase
LWNNDKGFVSAYWKEFPGYYKTADAGFMDEDGYLYVMSRTEKRGRLLAESFGAHWVSSEDWEKFLVEIDILIASTSAPHPIVLSERVSRAMGKRRHRPLFLIDIAVPRNIESEVHSLDDVYLYNIDDLHEVAEANLRLRQKEVREAEATVEEAVDEFQAWVEQLEAGPTIRHLHAHFDLLIEEELKRFSSLAEPEKARLKEFARRLRSKFLHAPLKTLKESSHLGSLRRMLEAIHTLFRLSPTHRSGEPAPGDEPTDEIEIPDRDARQ